MALPNFIAKFILGRDDNGRVTYETPWCSPTQKNKIKLNNGVEVTLSVPSWAYRFQLIVSPGGIVWAGKGASSLSIATAGWTQDESELNPILKPCIDESGNRMQTLRFIAENDCFVQVLFFAKNNADVTK